MKKLLSTLFVLMTLGQCSPDPVSADVKISQLPLGSATSTGSTDSFPYVNVGEGATYRLDLSDLINLPSMVSTYAPLAAPTFTGKVVIPDLQFTGCSNSGYALISDGSGNISCQSIGGTGTVTSVGLSVPSWLSVSGSPVTTSGTMMVSGSTETANYFLAAPNGSSGAMTPRAIVAADIPTLNQNTTGSAGSLSQSLTSDDPVIGNGTGITVGTRSGNTTTFATSAGSLTSGDCVSIDSNGNYVDAGEACGGSYTFTDSISDSGGTVTLSGDSASPGDSYYYGTNGSGTKGWYSLPSGTPGGSSGQVQYNSSGSFAGSSGFTYNGSGTVTATTFSGALSGNATTATALASSPTQCSGNDWATGIATSGDANCSQPAFSNISGTAGVSQGGTGAATLTSNAVLLGNGTSAVQTVSPGVTGSVLASNGTTWVNQPGQNMLINPSYEASTATSSWTAGSGVTAAVNTSTYFDGLQAVTLTFSSVTAGETLWYQDVTPGSALTAVNGLASLWVNSSQNGNLEVCPRAGGSTVTTACTPLTLASSWQQLPVNFIFPSSGSVGVALVAINSISSGTAVVDKAYLGLATNLAQVSQAQLIGQVKITGCSSAWTTTSTTLAAFSAQSGCTYTVTAGTQAMAPGTNIPGISFSSLPAGNYTLKYEGYLTGSYSSSSSNTFYQFWDGTNSANEISQVGVSTSSVNNGAPGMQNTISYSTAQSNITFSIRGATYDAGTAATVDPGTISVYYYPTQSQLAYASNLPTQPQVTVYTSGSGNYTAPAGATRLEVKVVGGGGGGAGSGTAGAGGSTSNGNGGGTTTFGPLSASGGSGPAFSAGGASGGSGSVTTSGSVLQVMALVGGSGQGSGLSAAGGYSAGGQGGTAQCSFGGSGSGGNAGAAGTTAPSNSGGGGGGAGSGNTSGNYGGAGGGAGGCAEAIILYPSGPYSYSVGTGGSGGVAGTGGSAAGSGAAGQVIVTAYFGAQPLQFVGQVSSTTSGQEHVERARVTCSSSSSILSQSGSWLSSAGNNSSGYCTATIATGEFSAQPQCTIAHEYSGSDNIYSVNFNPSSATSISFGCTYLVGGSNTITTCSSDTFDIICMGPR